MLIGHGTRDDRGTREFFELGECLAKLAKAKPGTFIVRPCLLEFQEPTIAQAWKSLIDEGVHQIVVAPLLLFSAGHAKSDIPDEIRRLLRADSSTNVQVHFAAPLSRQPDLIQVAEERLRESLISADLSFGKTAIVMVGRGSRDPCATSDMKVFTEVLLYGNRSDSSLSKQHQIGRLDGSTTFYAMAQPRLPDTLQLVADSGRYQRVIVQPHLLFAGRLYDAIQNQVNDARRQHPNIQWIVSNYLGPCEGVATAINTRIAAATNQQPICEPPR